jgi:hypothetical protein
MKIINLIKRNIDFAEVAIDHENNKAVVEIYDEDTDSLMIFIMLYDESTDGDGFTEPKHTDREFREFESILLCGEQYYCDADEDKEIKDFLENNLEIYFY